MKRKILNSVFGDHAGFQRRHAALCPEGPTGSTRRAQPSRVGRFAETGSAGRPPWALSRAALDSRLAGRHGAKRVIVRLSADSSASAFVKGADTAQAKLSAKAQQDAFLSSARALDPTRAWWLGCRPS